MSASALVRTILCLILALIVAQEIAGSDLERALRIANGVLAMLAIIIHVRSQSHKPAKPE